MDLEHRVLMCKLDSTNAPPDYGDGGRYWRFIGVNESECATNAFSQGVTAYTLDLRSEHFYPIIAQDLFPPNQLTRVPYHHRWLINRVDQFLASISSAWFRLELSINSSQSGPNYMYPTFSEASPNYFQLHTLANVGGPEIPTFQEYVPRIQKPTSDEYSFSTFEVGQGMCSVVYSDSAADVYLIDAGAGTPITRGMYLGKALSKNDLLSIVKTRNVHFILSHGDSDHWRLLSWDPVLRSRIVEYIVPDSLDSVAFHDKVLKVPGKAPIHKVLKGTPPISLPLGKGQLVIYRTTPSAPTSNNDGLVVVFENGLREKVLASGDCVYTELAKDHALAIQKLPTDKYHGIVVPHHGDHASKHKVPPAALHGSLAFFSAGDHSSYKHPTPASELAHQHAGFKTLVNKKPTGIGEVKLI